MKEIKRRLLFFPPPSVSVSQYLGLVEVEESRGMHVCEEAVKKLKVVSAQCVLLAFPQGGVIVKITLFSLPARGDLKKDFQHKGEGLLQLLLQSIQLPQPPLHWPANSHQRPAL